MTPEFITWAREVKGMRGALPDTPENRQKLQVLQSEFEQSRRSPAPSASVFDDLPETSMSASPAMPATTSIPDEDFSSLVPRPSENALVGLVDEESRAAAPAAQTEREPLDYDGLLGVLSVRQLDLQGVPPKTDRDGWKRANGALMQRFVDSSDDLAKFGIVDMATFDVLAREPYDVSRRAVENAKRAIEEGRAPDWDLAVKSAKEQTSETGTDEDKRFDLAEYKRTVGEDTPVAQAGGAFMSNQAWNKLGREVYETPRGMMDAATAAVKASMVDDDNAPGTLDNNIQVVESGFDYWRKSEPQRLKIAREVLGDRAGDTTDLTELKRSMSDSESLRYKDLLTKTGLRNPEIITIITKGPGAVNNDEILRRVQMASQMDIPLLDVSFDEKTGARSAQSVNMNPTVAASYMRTYGPKDEPVVEDRVTRLQETIDNPNTPLADRAQAEVALSREKSPGIVASVVGAVGGLLKSDPELSQLQAEYESLANSVFDPPFRQSGYTWRSKVPPKGNRKTGVSDETLEKTVYTLEDLRKRINARRQSLQKK
jgi:hypothetical protein